MRWRGIVRFAAACALPAVVFGCAHRRAFRLRNRTTVRIGVLAQPERLDPILANDYFDNNAIALVFNGLVRFAPDGSLQPDLATVVPSLANGGIARDGRTLTYHLRRDARWQDGVPVSVRDVAFTWRALMNPRNAVPTQTGYQRIAAIETPNRWTVRVRLRAPYAPAVALFARKKQGAIVPAHVLADVRDLARSAFEGMPVGSGAYRVTAWRRGEELDLARVAPTRSGFARVRLEFFGSAGAEAAALESGELDVGLGLAPALGRTLATDPQLRVRWRPTYQFEHVVFNLRPRSGPQTALVVRRAVAESLDVRAYRREIFLGEAGLAPLDQAPWAWARDRRIRFYPFEPRAARRMLRRAGYRLPVRLSLVSTGGDPRRARLEVAMQRDLARGGIALTIRNLSPSLLLAPATQGGVLFGGRFQLALVAIAPDSSDPDDELYVSSHDIPPHGLNLGAYRDASVDRLVAMAVATSDRAQRRALYARIQQRLIAALPFYTVAWLPNVVVMRRDVRGPEPSALGSVLWNVDAWSLGLARSR